MISGEQIEANLRKKSSEADDCLSGSAHWLGIKLHMPFKYGKLSR